jgi:hypothetical protein
MTRFVLLAVLVAVPAAAEVVLGAQLPSNARKVAELRYRLTEDWEGMEKYYRSVYPKANYSWKQIVNQPGIKALHITNPSGKGWEGLNIYQANDEIRVYVVPAEGTKTKGKKSGKK